MAQPVRADDRREHAARAPWVRAMALPVVLLAVGLAAIACGLAKTYAKPPATDASPLASGPTDTPAAVPDAPRAPPVASTGPPPGTAASAAHTVRVPGGLIGSAVEHAERALAAVGLQAERQALDGADPPAGTVVAVAPAPGTMVPAGSTVRLDVVRADLSALSATQKPGQLVGWTTDVGPDAPAEVASQVLDYLTEADARITFFVCGAWVDKHPALLERMVRDGHHLGNHTYNHPHLPETSDERVREEIMTTEDAILARVGPEAMQPKLFRPPYGEYTPRVLAIVKKLGYRNTMWDVDPIDWSPSRTPDQIAQHILRNTSAGDIVLTHVNPRTLAALPRVFEGLRSKGLEPVSLRALARSEAESEPPAPAPGNPGHAEGRDAGRTRGSTTSAWPGRSAWEGWASSTGPISSHSPEDVAVKVLRETLVRDLATRERFKAEARRMAQQVTHPNIAQVCLAREMS